MEGTIDYYGTLKLLNDRFSGKKGARKETDEQIARLQESQLKDFAKQLAAIAEDRQQGEMTSASAAEVLSDILSQKHWPLKLTVDDCEDLRDVMEPLQVSRLKKLAKYAEECYDKIKAWKGQLRAGRLNRTQTVPAGGDVFAARRKGSEGGRGGRGGSGFRGRGRGGGGFLPPLPSAEPLRSVRERKSVLSSEVDNLTAQIDELQGKLQKLEERRTEAQKDLSLLDIEERQLAEKLEDEKKEAHEKHKEQRRSREMKRRSLEMQRKASIADDFVPEEGNATAEKMAKALHDREGTPEEKARADKQIVAWRQRSMIDFVLSLSQVFADANESVTIRKHAGTQVDLACGFWLNDLTADEWQALSDIIDPIADDPNEELVELSDKIILFIEDKLGA